MAHSGKTITFATDLLPNEDLIYNLGKVDDNDSTNNRRWNIYGNLNGTISSTAGTSTLAWNKEVTLYTIGGAVIKAKLPSNPNVNTVMRTYALNIDDDRPILAGITGADGAWANYTSSYKALYGIISTTAANRPTINVSSGLVKLKGLTVTDTITGNISGNASTVNNHTVASNVPADAIFTDHYDWSDITSKPTTLSGYGITDASASNHNHNDDYWRLPSSITTSQVILSSGTSGETTTRAILNNTTTGALGWNSNGNTHADNLRLIDVNTLAYWNGAYSGNSSNIAKVGTITSGIWHGTKIANDYIANPKVTIAGNEISLGGTLAAATLTESLGLSTALHFVGITTTDMTGGTATSNSWTGTPAGISDYTPQQGDVVINTTKKDEWVCTKVNGTTYTWERLGSDTSYKIVQSQIAAPAATTNKWVSSIGQNANGDISVSYSDLNTSGTWSGNATTATGADITSTAYGVAYYSNTTGTFASTTAGEEGDVFIGKETAQGAITTPTWYKGLSLLGTSSANWTATFGGTVYVDKTITIASKVTLQWNATDQSLDFVFA